MPCLAVDWSWLPHCTDADRVKGKPSSPVRVWWRSHRTNLEPASLLWLWWCVALLAHYDDRMHWGVAPEITASVIVSAVGLFLARSPLAMMAVAFLQLCALWHLMPSVDNHWAFAGFVNLGLIGATATWIAGKRLRGQPLGPLDDDWYALAAPVVRLLVIVMYAFAVFHKLNSGFFDPRDSCAVAFYGRMTRTPLVPLWPHPLEEAEARAIIAAILAVEAAIPILLAGKRTWFCGIVLGVGFHLSTGMFMRHYPSIMMSLYWVFVPVEVQRRWAAAIDGWLRRATWNRIGYVAAVAGQSLALCAATLVAHAILVERGISEGHPDSPSWWILRAWNAVVVGGALVGWLAFLRVRGAVPHPPGRFRPPATWMVGLPVLFAINCLSPFLGLKTVTSINMWSNLVVTGTEGNHGIVSADAIRVFDYTADVVRVEASSDPDLRRFARSKSLVPWVMFRRDVQAAVGRARKDKRIVSVTYERGDEMVIVTDAGKDAALMDLGPYLERKLVKVKPTHGQQPARCSL